MKFLKKNGKPLPEVFGPLAEDTKAGRFSRREFLAMASAFGATAATAYGMIGLNYTPARAEEGKKGGVLKMQMIIKEMKDPRTWDWSEMANVSRQANEYLVRYNRDGTCCSRHAGPLCPEIVNSPNHEIIKFVNWPSL